MKDDNKKCDQCGSPLTTIPEEEAGRCSVCGFIAKYDKDAILNNIDAMIEQLEDIEETFPRAFNENLADALNNLRSFEL